jgi:glycosyltransferase involved in cell wall biosynthesis
MRNLLKYMDRRKLEPLLIVAYPGPFAEEMARSGCEVRVLHSEIGPMINKLLASKSRNLISFVQVYIQMRKDAEKLRRLLYEGNIDILHTHHHHDHILGAMACAKDIQNIWHIHGVINPKSHGLPWRIFNYYAYKYPSHIIAVSSAVGKSLAKKVQEKTSVIYNGIDANRFSACSAAESKSRLGFKPDSVLVGVVGRFVHVKGFLDFISMAEIVTAKRKDVNFVIVGPDNIPEEAEYRNECLRRIKQAHLEERFTITGLLADAADFMPALDILVLPTVRWWEGFGLVVLEAQASGKPVVSTDCGGPADIIVDGQTGYIVPCGDIEAMSERVLRLLSDKELAITMGAAGRVRAAGPCFNIVNTVRKIEQIYIRSVKSPSINV